MDTNTIFHNRYKLKKLLGRGQFSEVWLAEDIATKMLFALKIYAPATGLDDNGVQMLAREFALVANANHENLLRPTYFDVCDRKPYLVLPYCEQGSSQQLVGKMDEEEAWRFIHDVAAGLAYLHNFQPDPIIHQDIKPDNIMIGPTGRYMITDFGVSTHSKSALRKSIGAKYVAGSGTVAYMGPERFGTDKTPIKSSDIYSLGATVYEMITGDVPFGEAGGLTHAAGAQVPDIKGNFSPELKYAIRSCLHFNPWDRPQAETLVRWANTRQVDMPGGSSSQNGSSNKWIWAVVAGAVVVSALVGWALFSKLKPSGDGQPNNEAYKQYAEMVHRCDSLIDNNELQKANVVLNTIKTMDENLGATSPEIYNKSQLLSSKLDEKASQNNSTSKTKSVSKGKKTTKQ